VVTGMFIVQHVSYMIRGKVNDYDYDFMIHAW
jgi:hypothetical protein